MESTLETMQNFFTARVDGYDEHMTEDVPGCKSGYIKMAELVPKSTTALLDLGCGTGLELDEIFKSFPDISVTGIDLTKAMLEKLKEKHPDKSLTLICADYFKVNFGTEKFDCAVSFQTMHHFSHEKKIDLYKKIRNALKPGGCYIECDYMVINEDEEKFYYSENERLRKENNVATDEFYHYDTPCTVDNQMKMFKTAGFKSAELLFREENTTIILANV